MTTLKTYWTTSNSIGLSINLSPDQNCPTLINLFFNVRCLISDFFNFRNCVQHLFNRRSNSLQSKDRDIKTLKEALISETKKLWVLTKCRSTRTAGGCPRPRASTTPVSRGRRAASASWSTSTDAGTTRSWRTPRSWRPGWSIAAPVEPTTRPVTAPGSWSPSLTSSSKRNWGEESFLSDAHLVYFSALMPMGHQVFLGALIALVLFYFHSKLCQEFVQRKQELSTAWQSMAQTLAKTLAKTGTCHNFNNSGRQTPVYLVNLELYSFNA